jgi:fatty-acyl-CoA synthase
VLQQRASCLDFGTIRNLFGNKNLQPRRSAPSIGKSEGEGEMAQTEAHSYVRGTADSSLSDLTIAALLAETAARFPDRPAVVFREQATRWSWKEFANEVDAFAAGLQELGLRKGDRVGVWSPNRVEWLVTQFATARLGLVLVNVNPAYRLSELE